MKSKTSVLVFAALLLVRAAGATPVTITFDSTPLTTPAGTDVTFTATVTNPGAATEFLNGDSFTSALVVNDTPFFLNFPLFLLPAGSVHAPIFIVQVPSTTLPGLYAGVFDIVGGADPFAFDVIGSQSFAVNVTAAPTATVPEPATLTLVALGSLAARPVRRLRKVRLAVSRSM
jgi:PEP-CTERM motif